MATTGATSSTTARDAGGYREEGSGWVLFAGIMILTVGILNVIYGIAAIGDSRFFVADTTFILSGLNTWGWVMLVLGALQLLAAFSIWSGGGYGRWFGIVCAMANAVAAMLAIPAYPFWSLAIIAIDILVIYGLAAYGGDKALARR